MNGRLSSIHLPPVCEHVRIDGPVYSYYSGQLLTCFPEAGRMSLAFSFGMVGVVAGAGATLYLSASAASTVARAEVELERQRQKARELDYGLQTVAVELKLFAHENQGLV